MGTNYQCSFDFKERKLLVTNLISSTDHDDRASLSKVHVVLERSWVVTRTTRQIIFWGIECLKQLINQCRVDQRVQRLLIPVPGP